jgi:hypothetical protein
MSWLIHDIVSSQILLNSGIHSDDIEDSNNEAEYTTFLPHVSDWAPTITEMRKPRKAEIENMAPIA